MTSPHIGTPGAPLLAPAFKTNLARAKSKRWVEAKTVDYGGGGWGDDDDFDDDDPYGDDGYGPSYGAGSSTQGAGARIGSFGRVEDTPAPAPAPPKLSELGRPKALPRIDTHAPAPALGVPLPPTPLELEQREQTSRQNSLSSYSNPSPQGGILKSFLPQIMTSRSPSPARPLVRAQTMGLDKPLPLPAPQGSISPQIMTSRSPSPARPLVRAQTMGLDKPLPLPAPQRSISPPPPPPPAKERIPLPVGYPGGLVPEAPELPEKDVMSPPVGIGFGFPPMIQTPGPPQISPASAAAYSLDSSDRLMRPPKDSPVGGNSPQPWQDSSLAQAALPLLPTPPSPPPFPMILKDEPEKSQPEVLYNSPVSVERHIPSPPPPPKDEPRYMNKEQPPLPEMSPLSAEQYISPPPREVKRVENVSEENHWNPAPLAPVNQSNDSLPPLGSDKSGGVINYEDNHYGYEHEEAHDQLGNLQHSHHPLSRQVYQVGEYVDEEYYQPATHQHKVHHGPPQQSYQSSFTTQDEPIGSPYQPQSPASHFYSNSSLPPLSSSSPLPSPPPDSDKRFVRPSDIYARVAEERERDRIANEEARKSIRVRRSMDSQVSGGISIPSPSGVGLSIDSQRGHLSPEFPPQSRRRSKEQISDHGENTGSRPASRQDDSTKSPGRRNSRPGSRSYSRPSSYTGSGNGSRPGSRQDPIVRSPSPYPPPTGALPPVPVSVVPASPDSPKYDARIDELFAEHERREQEERRISSWNDDIIAGYGSSTEEVNSIPHQQDPAAQEWSEQELPARHRPQLDMRRSQSSGFKSLVDHAFIREDTLLPTPISPGYSTLLGPNNGVDLISPILPQERPNLISRSETLPSLSSEQMATMPPPLHRSWTGLAARDEGPIVLSPRDSMGAERGAPTVVPMVEAEGSRGEIAEATPETPFANQGAPIWPGVEVGQEEKYTGGSGDNGGCSGVRSPEKDDLDMLLGELERAQTPRPGEGSLLKERQPYGPSSVEVIGTEPAVHLTAHPEVSGQHQHQQQPLDSTGFAVVGSVSTPQHQGWEKDLPQRPQYEQQQAEQLQPFDPSSFGVIGGGIDSQSQQQYMGTQHQYTYGQEQEKMPFDPSSFGVVRPVDSPQYQTREKQLPQQSLGHPERVSHSVVESDHEGIGGFGLFDRYWKKEAASSPPPPPPPPPPPSPPPPPLKSPRRPSVPDLTMLLHASAPPPDIPSQGAPPQGRDLPPVSISDRATLLGNSASETPDSELMEMMIARRQFLARTQTGFSETEKQGEQKNHERESLKAEVEGLVEGVQDKSRPPHTSLSSGNERLQVIPPIRVLGPESEGIEVITGPTKVIREEPPAKEGGEDDEKTPVQSEFTRELVNQFSRPQTLMLKDTMPMPSGLLVMPPMPPREEGEEHVPEVVDFSVKDEDTDDETAKARLKVAKPAKVSISERPSSSGVEVGRPMQYMDSKDIARLPNSNDRIAAYDQASKAIEATPTGLGTWVRYMMDENNGAELLQLTPAEPKSRPGTSGGWRSHMAARVEDHGRPLPSGASATLSPPGDGSKVGPGSFSNGGSQRPEATPASSVTTTGSSGVANAAQGVANAAHNLAHAPAVEKTMDRAKGFFGRLGGKKGKETSDQQQHKRSASNIPSPQSLVPAPTSYQKQGFYGAPVAQPQPVQGQPPGFQAPGGHHRQFSQSRQGPVPIHGLQHGQQVPQETERLQRGVPPIQDNDLAQLVQRGQMIQQAQLIPTQSAQQSRQPPMTLEDSGQSPHSRPRSQPQSQSTQLAIPGQRQQQQRSVSATGPVQQTIVSKDLPYQLPAIQTQFFSESARSPPHSQINQGKEPESDNPTPPAAVTQSPVQQAENFPKRSDSLYSKSRSQDSRTTSPTVQRPDRSDSLSSVIERHKGTRSYSLSQQQESERLRADSLTLAPASTVHSDGTGSTTYPHNTPGRLVSVPPPPPPLNQGRFAGERRGQNAFAPREDPEPQQPHQLQQVSTPMTRSTSEQPPLDTQGGPESGIIRSQTHDVRSQPGIYQGNERQRGPAQQDIKGTPQLTGQKSRISSDDEDLYSPPPSKIYTQPRGPVMGGQFSPQQGYQLGQSPQSERDVPLRQSLPQEFGRGGPEPQQQQRSLDSRQFSSPPQINLPSEQVVPQGTYQRSFAPGDPRGQYQGGPQHPSSQQQQFLQGQPSYQGPPGTQGTSYGPQGQSDVRHSSSGLKKTLSGVSGHSSSTRYATSTTSSQDKKRSSIFSNLTGTNDGGHGSQQSPTSPTRSPGTVEPKMIKDSGRRTSFMTRSKKDKGDGSKKKDKGKSHKKGFSIDVFGRTGSMLGKLTRSPSPTAGTQYKPPSQPSPQQFQSRQVQPQRQSSENSWMGGQQQPRPQNQNVYTENMVHHPSQSLPLGAPGLQGSPPAASPGIPSNHLPQVSPQKQPSQQQFLTRHSSAATIQPTQQSNQPQYESVPIPAGYGRLQGEYDAGQGQFFHQPPLQHGSRQESSNVGGGRESIDRHPSQVPENRSSIDNRTISPELSRQGTQTSHMHETTRSLSPAISDGPPRSMTPASEAGQFGRQQSLPEGSLLGRQTPTHLSPRPSIRNGQGQDNQRYQQPLPLPQSIAQVQNGGNEYERAPSPSSVPLPISPPNLHPPFPPPVQVRSETLTSPAVGGTRSATKSPSPPSPPPKEEIQRQPAPMENGNMNIDTPNTKVISPIPQSTPATILSPVPDTKDKQKDERMEKEAVDFSTEKIAVNLDLHGPGSKKNGEESDDYVMSSTSYPGQAWEPSYYGWS